MDKRRIGVLTIVILAGVFAAYYYSQSSSHPFPFKQDPIVQSAIERNFSPLPQNPLNSVALDSIQNARLFNLIDESNWFLFDYAKKQLAHYNIDRGLVRYIGKGEGKGPGEFVNPTDYAVSQSGTTWVIDGPTSRVTQIDKNGNVLGVKDLERTPYRIVRLNDHRFALLTHTFSQLSFWDWSSNSWNTGQSFIEESEKWNSILDSQLSGSSNNKIIQVPTYLDFMVTYDQEGNVDQIIEQIFKNRSGILKYRKHQNNYSILRNKMGEFCIDVDANSGNVYVLKMKNTQDRETIIDIYDSDSGQYKKSYSLPSGIREIEVQQKYLFTMSADSIKRYQL